MEEVRELDLTMNEKALLAAYISSDGFKTLNRIMKHELYKFHENLLNANKPDEVIIAHNLEKAAAMFYQGVVNRINTEIDEYKNTPREGDAPIDVTEGILMLQDFKEG